MSDADDELEAIRRRKREALAASAATPEAPVAVDDEEHLQELLDAHDVVLVDFYADWCGPCKMLEPTVEAIAEETDAVVAKVDVDIHQRIAQQYRVQGVPTLVLFTAGEPVERMVGVEDRSTLESKIQRASA